MKCPVCDSSLRPAEREGVEVNYCPHYHGLWLDRGELAQIIERSNPIDWDWHRNDEAGDARSHSEMYW
jgi:uncharacterized protein